MSAPTPGINEKAATLKLILKADSGYTAEEEHRISAAQWGAILKIASGKIDALPIISAATGAQP